MKSLECKIFNRSHRVFTLAESPQPPIIGQITSGEINLDLKIIAKDAYLVGGQYGVFLSELSIDIYDEEDM